MKVCEVCRARFKGNPEVCPLDGGRLVDLPDPLIGRVISGRYVVTGKIGAGGMGSVYRARHEVVGRDVAIKFLAPDLALDATNRERFLREARAANRINHEHIIDITDFGTTDDGLVFLVMEYLDGRPLATEIDRHRQGMPVQRVIDIALQAAKALARAHELDVVHRDIKPDNMYLLSRDDQQDFVKILDFGLAHMKGELRLTASGTVFGTPEYMAPEQARGAPLTFAADLYSLGCVIWEMLTGHLPFTGNTPDLILKHMREPAKPPSVRRQGLPRGLDEMVLKLLSKDPSLRHRDAHALIEELRTFAGDERKGTSAPPAAQASPTTPNPFGSGYPVPQTNPPPPQSPPQPAHASTQSGTQKRSGLPPGGVPSSVLWGPQQKQTPPQSAVVSVPPQKVVVSAPATPMGSQDQRGRLSTELSRTVSAEDAWSNRVGLFREFAHRAHPRGDAPPWLLPSIDELGRRIEEVRAMRVELDRLNATATRQEDDMRSARLRIGRALDELARDESRVKRQTAETAARLEETRARLDQMTQPLRKAWCAVPPVPASGVELTREVAEALRDAGNLASLWLEAERAWAAHRRDLADREREREDLSFQLAQLKGRMGTLNVDSDLDLGAAKDRVTFLDTEINQRLDAVVRGAEPIVRHFMAFPEIRPYVTGSKDSARAASK